MQPGTPLQMESCSLLPVARGCGLQTRVGGDKVIPDGSPYVDGLRSGRQSLPVGVGRPLTSTQNFLTYTLLLPFVSGLYFYHKRKVTSRP